MLVYIGDKEERAQLREEPFDVCVASYEMALRDTEFFSGIRWKNIMLGSCDCVPCLNVAVLTRLTGSRTRSPCSIRPCWSKSRPTFVFVVQSLYVCK
jgi:hypothetical protein